MKACFPTTSDAGIDSTIHNHFGSAPFFTIVDTEDDNVTVIRNNNAHHEHGTCHPISQFEGLNVDAIVVRGIGRRALDYLNKSGLKVLLPTETTVKNSLPDLKDGNLSELETIHACGGHGHGSQEGHGHGHGHGENC